MKKTNVRTSKVININNVLFVVSGDIIKRQGVNDAGFEFNYFFSSQSVILKNVFITYLH